jgi:hypothetical protein
MTGKNLNHLDCIVAAFISVAAVWLHFIFLTHAGGLWRDEVAVANISRLPTLDQTWQALPHDHCPIVFPVLVRLWTRLGPGATDAGLRILGLACGLLLLAAFWAASRMLGQGWPLLSVALAGLNFTIIRYGDSIRAYGLATACMVLAVALIWRFMEAPNTRRGLMAGLAMVLSVQLLYQNAFFVLAIGMAGAVVCFRRNQPRPAMAILSIGMVSALSLLPYISPIYHAQSWWIVNKTGITWALFLNRMIEATGILAGVWLVLPIVAAWLGASYTLKHRSRETNDPQPDLLLFTSTALVIGLTGFGIFIKLTGLPTQCWYYIPAMGFTVVCCDAILPRIHQQARLVVLVVAVIAGSLALSAAIPNLKWRQTNGDQVAAEVSQKAGPNDLIIVHPWYFGLTFAYYYRGTAPWTTLPPLTDYRFHRYDLLKTELQMTNAIEPVLEKVKTTLASGHRVWLVGQIPTPQSGTPPANLPPAPYGPQGWADQPYSDAWGTQLSYFLIHHITNAAPLAGAATNFVNPMENMTLILVSGWHAPAQNDPP